MSRCYIDTIKVSKQLIHGEMYTAHIQVYIRIVRIFVTL